MKSIRASIRYAKALLDISREKGIMEDVKRDSDLLLMIIDENRDFRNFLKSAIIKPEQKIQTFKAALENELSEITNLFVNLLIRHGREGHLEDILKKYISQYFIENKIIKAQISSPTLLVESQKERLLALLKFKNASSIVLEETVDPELIGGFTLRVGDQQINASASEALSQLKREFNKNSYIADF
tara:strand:+ start:3751 stop:4308 length:558 start_codon:yes stop_codon:yes gene_type:complete